MKLMEKKGLDDSDSQAMSAIVSSAIRACVQECATSAQDIVTVCLSASGSGMTTMAQVVGKNNELTRDSLLYSCLFMARAVGVNITPPQDGSDFAGGTLDNNPVVATEAMEDMRKLTGKEPGEYLHPKFVASVAEGLKRPRPAKIIPFAGRHDIN